MRHGTTTEALLEAIRNDMRRRVEAIIDEVERALAEGAEATAREIMLERGICSSSPWCDNG